jgi:hypothetical protein
MLWWLIGLGAIGLVLTIAFAVMPVWLSIWMIPIGIFVGVVGAFTFISYLGQALVVAALLGIAVRCARQAVRSIRQHRHATIYRVSGAPR